MVTAVFICLDHINQQTGQVIGVGGGTNLVVNNAYRPLFFPRRSMVFMKFPPFTPNTQAILTMKYLLTFCSTLISPSYLVRP